MAPCPYICSHPFFTRNSTPPGGGATLAFETSEEVGVADPEGLRRLEGGTGEIRRTTLYKAILDEGGMITAVYGSYKNEGERRVRDAVNSFRDGEGRGEEIELKEKELAE